MISTRAFLLAMLLGASHFTFGQASRNTTARADAWMDSVSRLALPRQVAAVRARLVRDTLLRHPSQPGCLTPLSAAQRAAYYLAQLPRAQAELARPAGAPPLYAVDGYFLRDNYPAPTEAFLRRLAARPIQRITYVRAGASAAALYGARGANGVVLLTTTKRSAQR